MRWCAPSSTRPRPPAWTLRRAEDVAELITDFRCDYSDGRPLRWSPALVAWFLLDWAPRKVIRPEEMLRRTPDVLNAWVRHAARLTSLPAHALDEVLEAVEECRPDFAAALADPAAAGPAKQVVLDMLADGVDLDDKAAVHRWIDECKGRSASVPF